MECVTIPLPIVQYHRLVYVTRCFLSDVVSYSTYKETTWVSDFRIFLYLWYVKFRTEITISQSHTKQLSKLLDKIDFDISQVHLGTNN